MKINTLGFFRDNSGKEYEVLEEVKEIISRRLNGDQVIKEGSRSYKTACGIPVNVINGIFTTWDDVVLTAVD